MAFLSDPYGYGNFIGLGSSDLGPGLVLTNWIPDVLRYGKDALVFPEFLRLDPRGFGREKGDTFVIPIYSWNSVATTALTAGTTIEVRTQTVGSVQVTLSEYGDALSKEGYIDYISNINNAAEVQQTLGQTWADTLNALAGDVFKNGLHGARSEDTSGSYYIGTNDPSDNWKGTGPISGSLVEAVYDKMKANKVPTFPDGKYRWVGNAVTLRPVKRLAGWENMQLYNMGGEGLRSQQLGVWQGFTFVETEEYCRNQESFVFGQEVGAYSFGNPMDIWYYPDFQDDAGRLQVWKWYAVLGLGATLRDKGTHLLVVKTQVS